MVHLNFLRISALLTLFLISFKVFSQSTVPDETMPATIPAEILADWKKQGGTAAEIKASLPAEYAAKCDGSFESACHWRRVAKMKPYMVDMKKVLYAKHYNMGGGIVGFLSGLSSDKGSNWAVGSGLYILDMNNYYPKPEVLLEDAQGVIKDPCVSFDGKKVVFAWTKNSDGGGFHIFEIDVATKETRQITKNPLDLKVGDYEPCYLPTGDIAFSSSRYYSMVNCAYNTVGNMYICNKNGDWLRKVGFDQEASFTPVMMANGSVLYSRWEYNDRTRISCSAYFTMNPDGTKQTEYWGNQSDFPLMKYHAREIPNSGGKIMGIAGDHLAPYQGEVIVIDPKISRNNYKGAENASIKLIAPVRKAPVDPSTAMSGNSGGAIKYIFQNPWPFDEETFLVSWRPTESEKIMKIYFFNADASRELIAWDSKMSVAQPVVLDERPVPRLPPLTADYSKETGVFALTDANYGPGSQGVEKGKIKKIRVISIDYRTNYSNSSGVVGFAVNPIGRAFSCWLTKTLLGEMPVEEDGSACFTAPANTPVFFQTVDADGRMINTMRSWTTLMPGERFDCVGCHEDKNEAPPAKSPIAINPKPLNKPLGIEDKPMSFSKIIQPILDKNCTSCHNASHKSLDLRANPSMNSGAKKTFNGSYTKLTATQKKYVDWITQEEKAAPRTKFPVPGSSTSPLADMLIKGHNTDKNKITPEEREAIFCWIDMMVPHGGTYYEGMAAADSTKYVTYLKNNRYKHEDWEKENMKAFVAAGQWKNEIYPWNSSSSISNYPGQYNNDFTDGRKATKTTGREIRLIRVGGSIVLQCPGVGVVSLVDLNGRQIMMKVVTTESVKGERYTTLPKNIRSGLYIVKFKGKELTQERVISIM